MRREAKKGVTKRGGRRIFGLCKKGACQPINHPLSDALPRTLREIIEFLGSGGSMVARLKLKGIDGRLHQKWSLRLNSTTREISLG